MKYGPGHNWVLVRLHAADGTIGLGESSHSGADAVVISSVVNHIAPRLLGQQIHPGEAHRYPLAGDTPNWPLLGGSPLATAYSGVEQALWDLRARSLNVPLAVLLGGRTNAQVPLYANVNRGIQDRSPDGFARAIEFACSQGFRSVKCAPFDEVLPGLMGHEIRDAVKRGIERVEAAKRQTGHDRGLMIDCHARFSPSGALDVVSRLEQYEPAWLEEPVRWEEQRAALRAIRASTKTPIAAGELLVGAGPYLDLVDDVDVVMTDVQHCGGVGVARSVAGICGAARRVMSLHNPAGPVGTLVSAHVAAAWVGMGPLEYPLSEFRRAAVDRLAGDAESVVEGNLQLSDAPGIGVTLDEAEIARVGTVSRVEADR